jgi:predicted small secreted protein
MMKKAIAVLVAASFLLTACAYPRTICGVTYDTYGAIDAVEKHNPKIEYRISVGNIIWSVIFLETIIVPIWLMGFNLYYPVGPKSSAIGAIPSGKEKCPEKI